MRKIYYAAPIGRRSLAAYFQLGEKVLRREVQLLREQGLLTVEQQGISLTPSGKMLVTAITPSLKSLLVLTSLEEKLLKLLKVNRVLVVPGNMENDEVVLLEMGRSCCKDSEGMSQAGDDTGSFRGDILCGCCRYAP